MARTNYTRTDIARSLSDSGLENGDTAFFSTSLGMLGYLESANQFDEVANAHLEAIKEVVGPNGTIIVPTYSYTFGGSTPEDPQVFDPATTPAEIGPFPNFIIKQPGFVRSIDPMMSVSVRGPETSRLIQDLPATSYGAGSVFERLLDIPNAKCVSVGLGPNWTPFIHYADWLTNVPYRYDKIFFGGIKLYEDEVRYTHWNYQVPARIPQAFSNAHSTANMAVDAGIWSFSPLGRARVYCANYLEYFDFTMRVLQNNLWANVVGPECSPVEEDQKRIKAFRRFIPKKKNLALLVEENENKPRPAGGVVLKALLNRVVDEFGGSLYSFRTGGNHFDWVVPEEIHIDDGNSISAMADVLAWELRAQANQYQATLLVAYLTSDLDKNLAGLSKVIDFLRKGAIPSEQSEFDFLLASERASLAGYLQSRGADLPRKIIHIVPVKKVDPNQPLQFWEIIDLDSEWLRGDNPVALSSLVDLDIRHLQLSVGRHCPEIDFSEIWQRL